MIETVLALTLLAAAGSAYALVHLARLPMAPACPHCRSVTGQRSRPGLLDRAFAAVADAVARECSHCGWAGRMRWRPALGRTPAD